MITGDEFSKLALSFPGTEPTPHVDRIGFRVIGRRMFATYLAKDNTCNVFLTPAEQKAFCREDTANIYALPNKWGAKGATTFALDKVAVEIVSEALLSAYKDVMKPKPGSPKEKN